MARVTDVRPDDATRETFVRLSGLIYAGADAAAIHESIVDAARRLVDGCERSSLMLRQRGQYVTAAATDDIAARVDEIEREVREGPCLDAILDEAYQHDADLTSGTTPWPRFTERVVKETPVRSAIGYRLLLDGGKVGALNIFADVPGCLTQRSADQGAVLAAFASVALTALRAREEAETLRLGLQSNREIGKAVGLLMAAHRVDADAAFELLRRTSQDLNMKLAHVAEQVVRGQDRQYGGKVPPGRS
jgi:transcriptional regulator with GAF, ATPase, and Fis domain